MKKIFTLLFALMASLSIANATLIGDLYYDLDHVNKTASVALNQCAGDLVIPSSISYQGVDYCVAYIGDAAFRNCSGLTSVRIPNSVTIIGSSAFYNCSSLTSMTIPNNVTSIGWAAFYGCSGLTSVTIPNSVTSIEGKAFYGCTGLTSVTIPNSVTSIGDQAFQNCSMTSVTIPINVTSMGEDVFKECSKLTSITWLAKNCTIGLSEGWYAPFYGISSQITSFTFGAEVETIPDRLCQGMSSLESMVIPNSVTSIGTYAFSGCNSLTSLSISRNITNISSYAFNACRGLKTIEIPDGVTNISSYAFQNCSGLISINIPSSVSSISSSAFSGCSNLASVHISDITAWCNIHFYHSDANPLYYGADMYLNGTKITNLNIPSSTTNINDYAFLNCKSITSLTIPNSVTGIGYQAFSGCSNLAAIVIPDGVTSVAEKAFSDCTSAMSITIGANDKTFGKSVFSGCTEVTAIEWNVKNCTYESSVTSWENVPFYGIEGQITSFTFGETVETIPYYLCKGMKNLESITIPNSVTSIGNNAFSSCSGLASVSFGSNISSIGRYAFSYCKGLKSIVLPNSLQSMGTYAFESCTSLTSVDFPNSLKSISDYTFRNCTNLYDLNFSNGLLSIGEYAFLNCSYLYDIIFPNSLTTISAHAFENCNGLASVTIGEGVTSIGDDAFYKCSNMTSLTWNAINCANLRYYSTNGVVHTPFPSTVTSVTIGNKVQRIPGSLCGGMENLTSITIPANVTSMGIGPFANCSRLTAVYISDMVAWCNISFDGVPFAYSHNLYWNGKVVTDLVIPSGATRIGKGAFANCARISSVTIPKSVTSIGDNAFNPCATVDTFYVKSDMPATLGSEVFATTAKIKVNCDAQETYWNNTQWNLYNILTKCTSGTSGQPVYYTIRFLNWDGEELQSVQIEEGDMPAYIGATPTRPEDNDYTYTFNGWSPTITVANADADYTAQFSAKQKGGEWQPCGDNLLWKVENHVLTIAGTGDMPDYDPREDVYANGPKKVATTKSANYAPWGLDITTVDIAEGVTGIGKNAFCYYSNIASVSLPNSLTKIGEGAFWDCIGLTTLDIPAAVNNIGNDAFGACYGITAINVAADNANYSSIDGVLYNKEKTTLLQYPFGNSTTTFTVPDGVTRIGYAAFCYFDNNQLSVVIPASVTSIGQYAFYDASLKSITCKALTPPALDPYAFGERVYSATLYAPEQSMNTYKQKTGWKSFRSIQAITGVTAIESIQPSEVRSQKVLHNGQLFILRDGKTYTVMGQEVR